VEGTACLIAFQWLIFGCAYHKSLLSLKRHESESGFLFQQSKEVAGRIGEIAINPA